MEGVSSHGESETLHTPTLQNMETRPKSTLKILYYNARSLLPKFDELLLSADTHCPDVICITESWLCNDIQDTEIAIPGYQLVRLDRNRHGGGVLMYVLHKFIVKLFPTHPSLELLTVTIQCDNHKHCLSLFYRPPSSSVDVLSSFHSYLESINIPQFFSFVLIGDFNINFLDPSHPLFSTLCNILSSFGLTQVVKEHTHIHRNRHHSLIDLVLMSNPSTLTSCLPTPPLSNSDHLGIVVTVELRIASKPARLPRRTIWRYSHADWGKARELIENFDWDTLLSEDIDLSWTKWHANFMDIMEECIPQKSLPPRRNLPWMRKDIKNAMRKRDALFKESGYSAKFRSARNRVTNMLRRAKTDYFKNLNPRDAKQFWNKQQATIPTLQQGELVANSDLDKAETLNSYFSSCFNKSHPPLTALPPDPSSASTVRHDPSLDEMYCTVSEVAQLLQNVDLSKASGSDKISARMLKSTASSIAPSIHKLFNLSIRLGRIPHQWKHSMIVPIPKSTRMADPGNYRPISLISILCKLLEKHICSLMHDHLSNFHQLSNSQWGFRSGRSTVTALLSVTHDWFSALECGKEVCAVFFDYRKAFDRRSSPTPVEKARVPPFQ